MAPLPKQPVTFRFGPVDQDTGDKHLRPGQLTALENARQLDTYDFSPRKGFGRTAMSVDTGSFTGPPDTFVNAAGNRLVRDSLGLHFAHNGSTFVNRQSINQSSVKRPFMTSEPIYTPDDYASPVMVRAGGYDWTFFVDDGVYGYVVRDSATNRIVRTITGHAVAGLAHICPVTDGTTIFVFIAIASTTIQLDRYTAASPSTARTTTTYQTVASAVHNCVDAMVDDANDVYVVASSSEAANFRFTHSKLDKATGQAAASPAPVTTNSTKAAGEQCNGVSWLVNAGGSTIYYTIARPGTANTTALYLYSITKSTLAIAAGTVQHNIGALDSSRTTAPATCGYWDGSQPITYIGFQNTTTTRDDAERFVIRKVVGLGGTVTTVGRNCWIASKPFQVSSAWYLLTATSQPGLGVYHLREALAVTGAVIAQHEYGLGPTLYGNRAGVFLDGDMQAPCTYSPVVSGTTAWIAGISDAAATRFKIDFAAEYAPGIVWNNKAIIPGPIMYSFGLADQVREITPLLPPAEMVEYSAESGTTGIQICYRFTDADGTVTRSSPGPLTDIDEGSLPRTVNVPTLRHSLEPGVVCAIELYLTDVDSTTPVLRYIYGNDVTVDRVAIPVDRTLYHVVTPEAIYTTGGALASGPPPACKNVTLWRGRVIASGTPRLGQIVPSEVLEVGKGPRFNAILSSNWLDTTTDIVRLEPISWSDCAVFSTDRIGIISGNGPNGKGSGPYVVQTHPSAVGIKNARAAVNGKDGCYFQGTDLRYYLLTPQLEYIGQGVDDYTSPVSAALHDTVDHKIFFWLEDAKILVFDYDHPSEGQARGQWSMWSSSALLRGYGAILVSGVPEFMVTTGARHTYQSAFSDTNASAAEIAYNMIMTTGDLAVFDLGHCFRVSEGIVHGSFVASCTLTIRHEFDNGTSAVKTHEKSRTISAAPFQTMVKPSKGHRVQSVRVKLTLTAAGGGGTISGYTIVVQDRGITKFPNTIQRIVDNP